MTGRVRGDKSQKGRNKKRGSRSFERGGQQGTILRVSANERNKRNVNHFYYISVTLSATSVRTGA